MTAAKLFGRFAIPPMGRASKPGRRFSVSGTVGLSFALFCICLCGTVALAQTNGKPKAAKVAVSSVTTEIIADFAELQGRLVAGATESVTAVVSAEIEILDLRLGDLVSSGQGIAQQNHDDLSLDLVLLQAQLAEAKLKNIDINTEIKSDLQLLDLAEQQAALRARKAARAEELVANNALPAEAAETALSNSLAARHNLFVQKTGLARKKAQLALNKVQEDRLRAQIKQLDADIASTTLRARSDGQLVFMFDDKRGFAREGDVIARLINPSVFEVEVEVPVLQLAYLQETTKIQARTLDNYPLTLAPRVVLPVQNTRTATRIVRFDLVTPADAPVLAENAVVNVQLPVTSPSPVLVVPKDAVIPVAGGHIVYLADNDRAKRQSIRLGAAVASGFIVRSGLQDGDVVVTRGNEQLSDGRSIDYLAPDAQPEKKEDS